MKNGILMVSAQNRGELNSQFASKPRKPMETCRFAI